MDDKNKTEEKLKKIDKVTNIVTILVCTILGAVFLAACTYMLKMINSNESSDNVEGKIVLIKK